MTKSGLVCCLSRRFCSAVHCWLRSVFLMEGFCCVLWPFPKIWQNRRVRNVSIQKVETVLWASAAQADLVEVGLWWRTIVQAFLCKLKEFLICFSLSCKVSGFNEVVSANKRPIRATSVHLEGWQSCYCSILWLRKMHPLGCHEEGMYRCSFSSDMQACCVCQPVSGNNSEKKSAFTQDLFSRSEMSKQYTLNKTNINKWL